MRWKLAVAWVVLQVLFFAGWAATEQRRQVTGTPILVRTAPVDPRDLLRGQYLRLSYEFSQPQDLLDAHRPSSEGESVWVVLRPDGEYFIPDYSVLNRPLRLQGGRVALLGRRERWRVIFGIEEYYVQEGTETPHQQDTTVRVVAGSDGGVRIQTVLVKGEPWP
jgi:uncharacterized membrane-anchored protein